MILLCFFVLGGVVGGVIRYFLMGFAMQLSQQVHQDYQLIFSDQQTSFDLTKSTLPPLKCGHFLRYFIGFGLLFLCCVSLFPTTKALLLAGCFSLLFYIAIIDWYYQLISSQLCVFLFLLGCISANWQIGGLTLEQALENGILGFLLFYLIYWFAKYCYGKEALGRGDYWLMLGLGSFFSLAELILMVFIACVLGISYGIWLKIKQDKVEKLAFGSFLCMASALLLLLNWQGIRMID